jgi:hypothetical protein
MLVELFFLLWLPNWHPYSGAEWEECGHYLLEADVRWENDFVRIEWDTGQVETLTNHIGRRGVVELLEPNVEYDIGYDVELIIGSGALCWVNGPDGCITPQTGRGYIQISQKDWDYNLRRYSDGRFCGIDPNIFSDGFESGDASRWSLTK